MTQYYGIRNGSNYVIKNDGSLWEIGKTSSYVLVNSGSSGSVGLPAGVWNQFALGLSSALGIQSNGTLWGWGLNSYGQLGLNDVSSRLTPVQIGASLWKQVSAAGLYSAAIQSNGTLWSFGYNAFGQLGVSDNVNRSSPVQVGAASWKQVSTSNIFMSGIQSDGTLWSWGANSFGQLGLSNQTNRYSPVQVGSSKWKQIACGYTHVLGLQSDGTLWSWGANSYGQLGQSDVTHRYSPVQIGSSLWKQVSSGLNHNLAIQSDGTLWSWGFNASGQLGFPDQNNRSVPSQVGLLADWKSVKAGLRQSLAIKNDGTLWGWGFNPFNASLNTGGPPRQAGYLNNWADVFAGDLNDSGAITTGVAINSNGEAFMFGSNTYRLFGYDVSNLAGQSSAIQIGSKTDWKSFPSGTQNYYWNVAIDTAGTLYTWGTNTGWTQNYTTAVQYNNLTNQSNIIGNGDGTVISEPIPFDTNVSKCSIGSTPNYPSQFGVYIKNDGTLWGWGNNSFGQLIDTNLPFLQYNPFNQQPVSQISNYDGTVSLGAFTAFLNSDGTLWNCGNNSFGQLGLLDISHRSTPTLVGGSLWKQVSCGYRNFAGIQSNGTIWACGNSSYGQLGLMDAGLSQSSPIQVGMDTYTFSQIVCGAYHTLGVQSNGTLWAWGNNTYGQLGLFDLTQRSSPVQVGAALWKQVSGGVYHTLAVQSNGTLWSWGNNSFGQLGLSDAIDRLSPVQVGSALWSQIFAHSSVLGIQSNGTLWSWGNNSYGQLGLSDLTHRYSPVQIGAALWKQISTGLSSYAIQSNGTLWSWGNNSYGQLGQSDQTHRYSPVQVGAALWKQISTVGFSALGIQSNGTLWSWGNNSYGQLGLSDNTTRYSPVQLGATLWKYIAPCPFSYSTFGVQSDGTLWSWGYNVYGQLGTSNTTTLLSPVQVGTPTPISSVSSGSWNTLYNDINGVVYATGNNSYGQLGLNNMLPGYYKFTQLGTSTFPVYNWKEVSAGNTLYAINSDGTLWGSGRNNIGQLGNNNIAPTSSLIQIGTDIKLWSQVSIGATVASQSMASIQSDGTLWVCGYNDNGQLGLSDLTNRSSPVQVGSSIWNQISVGDRSAIGIQSNGTLWSWGNNSYGQLGLSDLTNRSTPVQVGSDLWKQAEIRSLHVLAIQSNGTLWSWGYNAYGQLGLSDLTNRSTPVQVGSSLWSQIGVGPRHALAIQSNGTLWSWGLNSFGQLGTSDQINKLSPVQVGSSLWKQIAGGLYHTLAIQSDGTLWSWGNNSYGQLGLSDLTNRSTPVQVGSSLWKQVAGTQSYSVAIQSDGTLWQWGLNTWGTLGILDMTPRYSPIQSGSSLWKQISISLNFLYGIQSDGTMWSSGSNSNGQLAQGISQSTAIQYPMRIGAGFMTNVASVNSTNDCTLAVKNDGTLWSWGNNSYGQLGTSDQINRYNPTQVGLSNLWKFAAISSVSSAAIQSDGTLWTWGSNSYGQLGQNNLLHLSTPTQVGFALKTFNNIFATRNNDIFAINTAGNLFVLGGANDGGEFGIGDLTARSSTIQVGSAVWKQLSGHRLSGNYGYTVGIQSDGTLWQWGSNAFNAYGNYTPSSTTPLQIGSGATWKYVTAASYNSSCFSLALKTDGSLWSWGGYQLKGEMGLNTSSTSGPRGAEPIRVGSENYWAAIEAGSAVFGIQSNGTLWGWGDNGGYNLLLISINTYKISPIQVGNSTDWAKISVSNNVACGIKNDGTLWAWGNNTNGQLGLNDVTHRYSPTQVGSALWKKVISGSTSTIGIQTNGTLWSWGSGASLGIPNVTNTSSPVQIGSKTDWIDISKNDTRTAAIDSAGIIYVAGANNNGELGNNGTSTSSILTQVGGTLYTWKKVIPTYYNMYGLRTDNTLWAWGNNSFGQLGVSDLTNRLSPAQIGNLSNWTNIQDSGWLLANNDQNRIYSVGINSIGGLGYWSANIYSPVQLSSKSNWSKVATGSVHTLLIDNNNALWALGNNSFGQLGLNDISHRSSITQIGSLTNWSQIACGYNFSAAIKNDGTLWAWGANSYGQLGQGDLTNRSSPVQVGAINNYITVYAQRYALIAEML